MKFEHVEIVILIIIFSTVDQKAQGLMALSTGKRHMLVQDIPAAVDSLGEACELLAAEFGETAPEVGEAYFYYGKALLEMARLESGVLGNGLDGGELELLLVRCTVRVLVVIAWFQTFFHRWRVREIRR